MNQLERRLNKIEEESKPAVTHYDTEAALNALIAKLGLTREEVMTRHGDIPNFCYWYMCNGPTSAEL